MKFSIKHALALITVALLLTSCNNCPTGEPEKIISLEDAVNMKGLFLEMDNGAIKGDNTDITFNLEDMQKYLHKMSELGKEQGYEDLGLRVHFARKTEDGIPKRTVFFETVAPIGDSNNPDTPDLTDLDLYKTLPGTSYYNMGDGGNNEDPNGLTGNGGGRP